MFVCFFNKSILPKLGLAALAGRLKFSLFLSLVFDTNFLIKVMEATKATPRLVGSYQNKPTCSEGNVFG